MTKRITDYTLAELDALLDHGPIRFQGVSREITCILRKFGSPDALAPCYQLEHYRHGEWQFSHGGGFNSLDEFVLERAFGRGEITSLVVDALPVIPLIEGGEQP